MADIYRATAESEQALAAATAETVLQLKGTTTTRGRILSWGVSFDGVSSTEAPVVVELLRQSTAGTSSGAGEPPIDAAAPAASITAFRGFSGAEPTAGVVLEMHEVHPQGGNLVREYPPGREPVLPASASEYIGIRCTAPTGVNALAFIEWLE